MGYNIFLDFGEVFTELFEFFEKNLPGVLYCADPGESTAIS